MKLVNYLLRCALTAHSQSRKYENKCKYNEVEEQYKIVSEGISQTQWSLDENYNWHDEKKATACALVTGVTALQQEPQWMME